MRERYRENIRKNKRLQKQLEKLKASDVDYYLADLIAEEYGKALSEAFNVITEERLPNGKMYFNIADRAVRPLLEENYKNIADACYKVQKSLNKKTNIGLKVVRMDEE